MRKYLICFLVMMAVLSCEKSGTNGAGEYDRDIPGTIPGVFSIGEGKRVKFSKGNLWCECKGTNEHPTIVSWHFEEHQYDCTPSIRKHEGSDWPARDSTHISHFLWCDSGEKAISLYYDDSWYDDSEFFAAHDFEVEGQSCWRVLTAEEWDYLLSHRECSTVGGTENARYFTGNIEGVCGLFIFPNKFEWSSGIKIPSNVNAKISDFDYGLALSDFPLLESKGLLFLPVAGSRSGNPRDYQMIFWDGCYYSNSLFPSSYNSMFWAMAFTHSGVGFGCCPKNVAFPIRLVIDL